jgi:hypothetical protein
MKYSESDVFGNQIGAQMNGRTVKLCMLCGALSADQQVHTNFHNSLVKANS